MWTHGRARARKGSVVRSGGSVSCPAPGLYDQHTSDVRRVCCRERACVDPVSHGGRISMKTPQESEKGYAHPCWPSFSTEERLLASHIPWIWGAAQSASGHPLCARKADLCELCEWLPSLWTPVYASKREQQGMPQESDVGERVRPRCLSPCTPCSFTTGWPATQLKLSPSEAALFTRLCLSESGTSSFPHLPKPRGVPVACCSQAGIPHYLMWPLHPIPLFRTHLLGPS